MADKAKAKADPGKPDDKAGEDKPKTVQPKDEVGTRKGCRRYKWELKDSNKEFWLMGHAEVKIISLGCLMAGQMLFNTTKVHPILTLILTMEVSIHFFYIILYTFAINRYMPFIVWPISDLLNDLFTCVFLIGGMVFAVKNRRTMPLNYFIAVVLMGVASLFCFIDLCLQRQHFKGKKAKKGALIPPDKDGKIPEVVAHPGAQELAAGQAKGKAPAKDKAPDKGAAKDKDKDKGKGKGKK